MSYLRIKLGARIRDVAEAAGVSKTTVSLVANGRAGQVGICLATRQRVETMIREMGYRPSSAALGMATGNVVESTPSLPEPTPTPEGKPQEISQGRAKPPAEPQLSPASEPTPSITTPPRPEPVPSPVPLPPSAPDFVAAPITATAPSAADGSAGTPRPTVAIGVTSRQATYDKM